MVEQYLERQLSKKKFEASPDRSGDAFCLRGFPAF